MSAAPMRHFATPATSAAPENPPAPAAGARHNATSAAPFDSTGLTPVQAGIAAALASGTTIVRAALDAGVHRATIHKWLQTSKAFCDAVKSARDHYDDLIADQLNELSALAIDTLRQLLTNPDTPAAIRLRAALAVLNRPTSPAPLWRVPRTCGIISVKPKAPQASPEQPAAETTEPNAPCPCGSSLKYKHCCGSPDMAWLARTGLGRSLASLLGTRPGARESAGQQPRDAAPPPSEAERQSLKAEGSIM